MLPSLPKFALDSHLIFVLPSLSISRYFCKDSLMTPPPPNTPPHFKPFSIRVHSCSIRVHSCSIRVHSCSLVFIRVHSCSFVFHSCSLVFIRVLFVFTRVHSCSLVFHSCSTCVHSCSFVFVRVHSCSFVFRSVWCFRYDPILSYKFDSSIPHTFISPKPLR